MINFFFSHISPCSTFLTAHSVAAVADNDGDSTKYIPRYIRTIVYLLRLYLAALNIFTFPPKTSSLTEKIRWHNGNEIKSSASHFSSETSEVVSQLFIENVTRDYYGSKFECRAQNSKVLSPVVKEILVQIHCKSVSFVFLLI